MCFVTDSREMRRRLSVLLGCALTVVLSLPGAVQAGDYVLSIGSSGATTDRAARRKEESSLGTLQQFITDETGLTNKITPLKDWRELAEKMAKKQIHLGVFEGYEFAWAQAKHPDLRPLAVAVNVHRYPIACVVVNRDNPARNFAELKGKSLFLPAAGPHHLRVFVERRIAAGKKAESYFSRTVSQGNVEDALDDVVDGVLDAAAVDRTALEAYKRRKPGRFNRLKELGRSQPFPPPVIAYFGSVPDEASRRRFRQGMLAAGRKERGKMMLTLFRVTGFEEVPDDLGKVLSRTRKDYPPPVDRVK